MNLKEPLFFKKVYKNPIWGQESWELSAHKNGISYLIDSDNVSLVDLFNNSELKEQVFGKKCVNMDRFPILIKFINANKDLSVQVHPNDTYAMTHENDYGKNETWYVMDCNENNNIIYGLNDQAKDISNEDIVSNISNYLNYQSIHRNDFISIPSGTIHAILSGTTICEIQQSSDITYRIYDWDRVDSNGNPRELHREKAIDVINKDTNKSIINCDNMNDDNIYASDNFYVDIINIFGKKSFMSNSDTFIAYVVIDGKGIVKTSLYQRYIEKGETFLIPSNLGEYELEGKVKLLKVHL